MLFFNPNNIFFLIIRRYRSNLNIIFYGSDNFSLPTLKSLHSNLILPNTESKKIVKSLHICTSSEVNVIGSYCKKHNLKMYKWPYSLSENFYDIGIVVSFGKLIPKESISSCKYGILNVHPSLLPKLRGSAPIQRAILNDNLETGVTIMSIKPDKFDVGDILLQEKVFINEETTYIELIYKLSKLGIKLLFYCLFDIESKLKNSIKQNSKDATLAPKIKLEETRIIWNEMNIKYIYKLFRALNGYTNIYTDWKNGEKLKLLKMINPKDVNQMNLDCFINKYTNFKPEDIEPGLICFHKKRKLIFIRCIDNWAGFSKISIKNHKKMSALEFNNGFLSKQKKKIVLN